MGFRPKATTTLLDYASRLYRVERNIQFSSKGERQSLSRAEAMVLDYTCYGCNVNFCAEA